MNFLDNFRDKSVMHISHNDLDGVGSTVLGLYFIQPISKEYFTINSDKYDLCDQDKLDFYLSYFDVYLFTDFPVEPSVIEVLRKNNKQIVVVDHHQTGNNKLKNILSSEEYFYDINKCGTKILLDEIAKKNRVKKVVWQSVELINIYDLYQMKSSLWRDAKGLHNILWAQCKWDKDIIGTAKYVNFINSMMYKYNNYSTFNFSEYERNQIIKAEGKEQENLKQAKRNLQVRTDGDGNTYGYFECTSKQSIVANYILTEREDLKYVVVHVTWGETEGSINPKVSVRSVEGRGIDCSTMCALWQGGGHTLSSGIEFKNFDDFDKLRKGKLHLI